MNNQTTTITLTEAQKGPAEKLLDLVLNASAHLWHNRPGLDVGGTWQLAGREEGRRCTARDAREARPPRARGGAPLRAARSTSTASTASSWRTSRATRSLQTDWRDLKVACAALMLVQPHAGQPIKDDDGEVALPRRRLPRRRRGDDPVLREEVDADAHAEGVLRVAELLETPRSPS